MKNLKSATTDFRYEIGVLFHGSNSFNSFCYQNAIRFPIIVVVQV